MKKQLHFEIAITIIYFCTGTKLNNGNRVIINPVHNFVGIVCILHSFTQSRSFRVYNEENYCKHLLNIAHRLDE